MSKKRGVNTWADPKVGDGPLCEQMQALQRVPLTDEQISNCLRAASWPESMLSVFVRAKLVELVRATERAHGIATALPDKSESMP